MSIEKLESLNKQRALKTRKTKKGNEATNVQKRMDSDFGFAQCAPADRTTDASVLLANRFNLLGQAGELPS